MNWRIRWEDLPDKKGASSPHVMDENRHLTKHIMKQKNIQDKKYLQREPFSDNATINTIRTLLEFSTVIGQEWSKSFKILQENYFQAILLYSNCKLSSGLKHFQIYKDSKSLPLMHFVSGSY